MNYGLYIAASGAQVNMARQDVLSNNLANVTTTAFKPDVFAMRQRDAARIEDGLPFEDSNALLERLGAGVLPMPTRIQTAPHGFETSANPLDLAIVGEGFFQVAGPGGGEGEDATGTPRLTRDGRLTIGPDGRLVTAAGGRPVLDEGGGTIRLERDAPVTIDSRGVITQRGRAAGRIGLVTVADPSRLVREGEGLFRVPDEQESTRDEASGTIRQGALERSGTDAIRAMMEVTSASNAVSANLTMIANINELMGRAINTLGRVT